MALKRQSTRLNERHFAPLVTRLVAVSSETELKGHRHGPHSVMCLHA